MVDIFSSHSYFFSSPRECNRLVARKTRVKKKIELDLLQNSFNDYRYSNNTLRTMLKAVVTREVSAHILLDCNFQLPNNVVAIVAEMIAAKECQHYITCRQVGSCLRSFCITNPTVFDNPIAYASQDFGELTGYDDIHTLHVYYFTDDSLAIQPAFLPLLTVFSNLFLSFFLLLSDLLSSHPVSSFLILDMTLSQS